MIYIIVLSTVPNPVHQYYEVQFEIEAEDEETAIDKAYKLTKKDFPDRSRSNWKIQTVLEV